MSITASWLILAVILLRALFKNGPKYLRCLMWAMVGIRLLCPFSFESVLSLIPSAETVPQEILYSVEPEIHSGISSFNNVVNPVITQVFTPDPTNSINPLQTITSVASIIWILGMAAMLIYAFVGYRRIHIKVREAIELKDNIWICDCISTPFILGVFRPRIFLPSTINESDIEYIIAHEKAHLKRRDHWWKPLGFVLLSLYWFNPLVWLAYILLCRDIEFACDEKVLKEKGLEIKKPYSNALINCSLPCRIATAYPLAFSEDGVKGRVKAVLNYKKPRLWVVIAAIVCCAAVSACLLTNPPRETTEPSLDPYPEAEHIEDGEYDEHYYYRMEADDKFLPFSPFYTVSIHLNTKKQIFRINWPPYSSYIGFGNYEYRENGDVLVLKTDDGLNTYTFKVSGDDLIYDERNSNGSTWDAFKDGSVFSEQTFTQATFDAYGSIDADIDGDGVIEHCSMGFGPTSGLFTFTFSASANGEGKYFNIFHPDEWYELSFIENNGNVQVCAESQGVPIHYFDISVKDGNVVLTEDGRPLPYWGAE